MQHINHINKIYIYKSYIYKSYIYILIIFRLAHVDIYMRIALKAPV